MQVTLIAAMDRSRIIGGPGGGIPWHLPRDSAHLRNYTRHRHMLLGRRTFEEMDGWFTTQTPIVLTRNRNYRAPRGLEATSMESALKLARRRGETNLIVAGGASVYTLALPHATRLVLTLVDVAVERKGGASFPECDSREWREVSRESFPPDAENQHAMSIVTRIRESPPSVPEAG